MAARRRRPHQPSRGHLQCGYWNFQMRPRRGPQFHVRHCRYLARADLRCGLDEGRLCAGGDSRHERREPDFRCKAAVRFENLKSGLSCLSSPKFLGSLSIFAIFDPLFPKHSDGPIQLWEAQRHFWQCKARRENGLNLCPHSAGQGQEQPLAERGPSPVSRPLASVDQKWRKIT
jgi:hypothetical protein